VISARPSHSTDETAGSQPTHAQSWRSSRWVRIASRIAALALVAFLVVRLRQFWRESAADFSNADAKLLVIAAIVSLVAVLAYGSVWAVILGRIGAVVPRDSLRLFLQSQLGKYLPGSVWHYAGRIGLAKSRGVAVRSTMVSLGIEVIASGLAALIVGLLVLPLVVAVPVGLAVAVLVAVPRIAPSSERVFAPLIRLTLRIVPVPVADLRPALRATPSVTLLYVPVWALYGVAFWLTARALFPVSTGDIVYFTGAFALGWLAGMIVVFAPGGIGVREAVLVGLLGPRIGHTEAIVVAGASRILLTASDLVGGTAALTLSRLAPRPLGAAPD
jgi:uncharacterized membrane protein YbhN (UPF0104 family)